MAVFEVLDQRVGYVDAIAVNTAVRPETHGLDEVVANLLVIPVEVRLLLGEQVHVPLARGAIWLGDAGPSGRAEVADQLGWANLTVLTLAVAEDVAVALRRALWCLECSLEPFVLVARVVRHDVNKDTDACGVQGLEHGVELFEGSDARVDVAIVGNVITAVGKLGWVERAEPHGVNTEFI